MAHRTTAPGRRTAGRRRQAAPDWLLEAAARRREARRQSREGSPGFSLPYTAKGKEVLAANYKTVDPEARCLITGMPRLLTSVLPFEILHTPQRLGTFHTSSWHRWVWLDGRRGSRAGSPIGNAIGRWDGDTLVIESSGFQDSASGNIWLDDNANPISGQATVGRAWTPGPPSSELS